MTREILFRGKHLKTPVWGGERWVYGSYIDANEDHMIIPENAEYWGGTEFDSGFLVSPETVGQYTRLKDKNGKRIFEGDIVDHHVQGDILINRGVIHWDERSGCWSHRLNSMSPTLALFNSDAWEVVGNIHDNPELLEGGNTDGG